MSNFNKEDVLTVAKALVDDAIEWDNGCSNCMNARDGFMCNHCDACEFQNIKDFKHKPDCPVLVAQDLLT